MCLVVGGGDCNSIPNDTYSDAETASERGGTGCDMARNRHTPQARNNRRQHGSCCAHSAGAASDTGFQVLPMAYCHATSSRAIKIGYRVLSNKFIFPRTHQQNPPPRSVNRMSVPRDCARVVSGSLPPKMSPTLLQREKVSEMHAEKFECVCKCNHSERSNRLDFGLFLWGNTAQFLRLCWDGAIDVENKMNRMN